MINRKEYFESYSNLAYNVAGFVALVLHEDILVCLGLQALGVGSFIYHFDKSPSRESNPIWKFDWWAISFLNTIIAGVHFGNIQAWVALTVWHALYGYVLLGRLNVYVEVALSSGVALTAVYLNTSLLNFGVVFSVFLAALAIRARDEDPKQLKFHDSTWHSLWHILTAVGYYLAVYLNI